MPVPDGLYNWGITNRAQLIGGIMTVRLCPKGSADDAGVPLPYVCASGKGGWESPLPA